jgi:proteasome lid subunit RPN8/RPN11
VHLAIFILATLGYFDYRRAADDLRVLSVLQEMAVRGAQQVDDREVAAFLVQDASGSIASVKWPHSGAARSERYDGVIPAGTVAIAHTHPTYAPLPSRGDVGQAMRIGLPIYVITRWSLYVVDPTSGTCLALIEHKNWMRSPRPAAVQATRN